MPPRTETAGAGVMWDWGTLLSLFLLGFFGGTHCVGMCGGLSSAFALQLPPHIRRVWLILLMNCGRIASYVLIGALMGLLSGMGSLLNETHTLQIVLLVLANILLLLMGEQNRVGGALAVAQNAACTAKTAAHPQLCRVFRRGRAVGLAAVRAGVQCFAVRAFQRFGRHGGAVFAGIRFGHAAQSAGDGDFCRAVAAVGAAARSAANHGPADERVGVPPALGGGAGCFGRLNAGRRAWVWRQDAMKCLNDGELKKYAEKIRLAFV